MNISLVLVNASLDFFMDTVDCDELSLQLRDMSRIGWHVLFEDTLLLLTMIRDRLMLHIYLTLQLDFSFQDWISQEVLHLHTKTMKSINIIS